MKHHVFSIFDSKAEAYLPPFFLPNVAMALRTFTQCCNSDDHQFGQWPADYTLFELGTFDDMSGTFVLNSPKLAVANGVETLIPETEPNGEAHVLPQVEHGAPIQERSPGNDPTE